MGARLLRVFFTFAGFLFLGLGAIGVVIRGLPTTPFLLLASFCFLKGNKKISDWFQSTKLYQKYLADYIETRSMTKKKKIFILGLATVMMTVSIILAPIFWVRMMILGAMLFMYYYFFFRIKTRNPKPLVEIADE